jgi:hypothetical protein
MIDVLHPTATSNLVAIDIAKDCNVALMQETSGRQSFKFANRCADHDECVQYLHSLSGPVQIGLQPTGDYQGDRAPLRAAFDRVARKCNVSITARSIEYDHRQKTLGYRRRLHSAL